MVVLRTRASWAFFVLAVAAIALTRLWWVTSGNFRLLEPVGYPGVYEAQARSFLSGHTDIACGVASGEAFGRTGKCYSYLGPLPALRRLPMLWLTPELDGQWEAAEDRASSLDRSGCKRGVNRPMDTGLTDNYRLSQLRQHAAVVRLARKGSSIGADGSRPAA